MFSVFITRINNNERPRKPILSPHPVWTPSKSIKMPPKGNKKRRLLVEAKFLNYLRVLLLWHLLLPRQLRRHQLLTPQLLPHLLPHFKESLHNWTHLWKHSANSSCSSREWWPGKLLQPSIQTLLLPHLLHRQQAKLLQLMFQPLPLKRRLWTIWQDSRFN